MNRKLTMNLLLGLATVALLAPAVRADSLTVTLTEASQTVVQGTTVVTFDATILNPSVTDTIFLNSDGSSASFPLTLDDTPFLLNAPLSLDPGASSGPFGLFDIDLPLDVAPGSYSGTFQIIGGVSATDFSDVLANVDFTVDVKSAVTGVPEPGTILLLASGLAALGFFRKHSKAMA
ncbi:MAG: PEP-CTERM sorting domain-containing protein [Candidatus Acidiferrales bacterium]